MKVASVLGPVIVGAAVIGAIMVAMVALALYIAGPPIGEDAEKTTALVSAVGVALIVPLGVRAIIRNARR
jgi:hypothetical protein